MTWVPTILPALFDQVLVTEEVELYGPSLSELLPEEALSLPQAAPARLLEFRAGRHCARVALGRLGLAGRPVLRAEDRSPVWPEGFVGSIAHTRNRERGFCGAVVARRSEVLAVGLDVELDEPLERKLWQRVLTASELARIEAKPPGDQGFWGKLVFSAKECAYKCQYPLSRQFLEFADVEVAVFETRHEFEATLLREAGPFPRGTVFGGRFVRDRGIIATGAALLRAGTTAST